MTDGAVVIVGGTSGIGRRLAEVAAERGITSPQAAMQLVVEDESRVGAAFFQMSEENVRRGLALPWVSICSDSAAVAPEGVFVRSNPHPRAAAYVTASLSVTSTSTAYSTVAPR